MAWRPGSSALDGSDAILSLHRRLERCFAPALLVAVLATAISGVLLDAPAPARTLLAAPLYYLVPLGVGLLFTCPFGDSLSRTVRLLLSYFVGLVVICAVAVARERAYTSTVPLDVVAAWIAAVSVAGFVLGRRLFRWDAAARLATRDFAVVLPIFAIGFALRFVMFSENPITDLFQLTHLMKGALEFGRFGTINPFTADSYVPVLPVMEGLMFAYFRTEPLHGLWAVSALSALPKFLALRAVFYAALDTRASRLLALAATVCLMSPLASTNGDLVMLGSLLVLSTTIGVAREARGMATVAYLALGAAMLMVGYMAARSAPVVYAGVLTVACLVPLLARPLPFPRFAFCIVPLVIAMAPIHRGIVLFFPAALLCGVLFALLHRWAEGPRREKVVAIFAGVLTSLAALSVGALLAFVVLHPVKDMRDYAVNRWIVETILGAGLSGNREILLGSGPKVALFELGRMVNPGLVIAAGLVAALAWTLSRGRAGHYAAAGAVRTALVAWSLAVALASVLLLGVPFSYRSGFFVIVLAAVVLASAHAAARQLQHRRVDRFLLAFAAVYVAIVLPLAYVCRPAGCRPSGYLEMAWPFLAAAGLAVVAAALIGLLLSMRTELPQSVAPTLLVLTFALEVSVSKAHFMPYSYGPLDQPRDAISHLSEEEVRLAGIIRKLGGAVVLVSDPYTMANLRALTGLNSIVSFSNLDTQSTATTDKLRGWLRGVIDERHSSSQCAAGPLLDIPMGSANSPEFNYWLARASQPALSGREILEFFDYRGSFLLTGSTNLRKGNSPSSHEWIAQASKGANGLHWNGGSSRNTSSRRTDPWTAQPMFLLVIGSKTIAWVSGGAGYYPDVRPLDPRLLTRLKERCDVRVHDDRFALVRLLIHPTQ